ncbi:MAG: hypothetical protein Crog4KO_26060 [Crocinitomicaceae bacterium]
MTARVEFIELIVSSLQNGDKLTRLQLEKQARELGISDKREVKELIELSVLKRARQLLSSDIKTSYSQLKELYSKQPNSSYRSTDVIKLRQYSTPLPISYLLGRFVRSGDQSIYFEPSAGNGLLTIGLPPKRTDVNEIDALRTESLKLANFNSVSSNDASIPMQHLYKTYDGVVSNPPFGKFDQPIKYQGYDMFFRDHLMVLTALETMKDDGRAAFVIGTHMRFAQKGRISVTYGRAFFSYLYSNYNVVDFIPLDGKSLYSRQGTAFDVSVLLIDGRKKNPSPVALTRDTYNDVIVSDFETLFNRITKHIKMDHSHDFKNRARQLAAKFKNELGAAYIPASASCNTLQTEVPDTMAFEIHQALKRIKKEVGGDIDNFVRDRLGYSTKIELCKVLSAEQIDAVALALFNIEAKDQGCIIGDQTGVGKGRVAAAILRYAVMQGLKPIFLTERANLFSDIYRDLAAIGSAHLRPFIVNSKDTSGASTIKDLDGNVLYSPPTKGKQQQIFRSADLEGFDIVLATYSQFNALGMNEKKSFLQLISRGEIIVSDESHNASGASNTGAFLKVIVSQSKSTIFSSATFAKRPENLPLYALKTSISDANMSSDHLVEAISKGGVALQEIIASQLVSEGQMIRRERSYEGVKVEYRILEEKREEHFAMADNITAIMRDIIAFQNSYVKPLIEDLDKELAKQNQEIRQRGGTSDLGVSNRSYFSKAFNIINQMLLAIEAESVADEAISQLRAGKKPVIAFSSTMGSFLNQLVKEEGILVDEGEDIQTDFALILKNGLNGILRYSRVNEFGESYHDSFEVGQLSIEAQAEYFKIMGHIEDASTGVFISPIDVILDKIRKAGFSVEEVTGRSLKIDYDSDYKTGRVERRKKVNVNDAFNAFNNNEIDVLLINKTGSTGGSAHAIVTPKVPRSEVKPRVMIVLQMELNIDTEIQKRGRINRTGQVHLPEYVYINSAIPAEMRMMMMLRMKLKSLDANTSSNQNQNKRMIDVPDYLNKYGDRIVKDYIDENPKLYEDIGSPEMKGASGAIAHSVTGRIAVMPTSVQEEFYNEIVRRYLEYVDMLKQTGDYDLELEELNLQAKTIAKRISVVGRGGASLFGADTFLEKVEANVLRKPFQKDDLKRMVLETLGTVSPEQYRDRLLDSFVLTVGTKHEKEKEELKTKFEKQIAELRISPVLWRIHEKQGEQAYESALAEKKERIEQSYQKRISGIESSYNSLKQRFFGLVKFFTVGRALTYRFSDYIDPSFAVFVGFDINENNKNPFAPSNIKLRFAIASSMKYLVYPMSYQKEIDAIRGASADAQELSLDQMYHEWERHVKDQQKNRTTRYIMTGNLLQAALDGKLVSYTTHDGKVNKGVLLPEQTEINFHDEGVIVPLSRTVPLFESLAHGKQITLSHQLTITRSGDYLELRTPSSKKNGGMFFMSEKLIAITRDNKFEKVSNTMRGEIHIGRLIELLEILENLTVNITLTLSEYEMLNKKTAKRNSTQRKIKKPLAEQDSSTKLRLFKMKAKALKLKMEMLSLNKNSAA